MEACMVTKLPTGVTAYGLEFTKQFSFFPSTCLRVDVRHAPLKRLI